MIKSIVASILTVIIATGTPFQNVDCMQAKAVKQFTERGVKYTMMATEDGNGWVVEGRYKKSNKYVLLFDNKGTKSIYDDEVLKVYKVSR